MIPSVEVSFGVPQSGFTGMWQGLVLLQGSRDETQRRTG